MVKPQQRYVFSGMQILINQTWVMDQALVVEEGKIKAIIAADMIAHHLPAVHKVFSQDCFLAPGMIDMHIHGAAGHDVMDGTLDAFKNISLALAKEGVTGFLATTMTVNDEKLESVLQLIPQARQINGGAEILGVHLEGPFLAKLKSGAQNSADFQDPNTRLIKKWQALTEDNIRIVTLAPELPHAIEFIELLDKMNIISSVGHTHATYAETIAAIAAGCTYATHLFNAMRGITQREPGALGALLLSNKVTAELIVDGFHLHSATVDIALRMKGKENLLLVSDAMRAKCMGDGEFDLADQHVTVKNGKAVLEDGTLAGSTLRLPQALKNLVTEANCNLADALMMASTNPAKILGLEGKKGRIATGLDADLFIMNADMEVLFTMRDGREIFAA